jgi:hypothetical protein
MATLGEELSITLHVLDDENVEQEKEFFAKAMQTLKNLP